MPRVRGAAASQNPVRARSEGAVVRRLRTRLSALGREVAVKASDQLTENQNEDEYEIAIGWNFGCGRSRSEHGKDHEYVPSSYNHPGRHDHDHGLSCSARGRASFALQGSLRAQGAT